jgi:4-amino-4-deoxy-L-arabinose transferase-like glycosyltransferase
MKSNLAALALILFVTLAVRLPCLDTPFERDEGEYAYIAWRLDHDELPYRNWVDQKPPGIFWAYRIALSLPVEPIRAVHLMGLLFAAASACALFFLARRFTSDIWATGAAALFGLLLADPMINGTAANTELFMLLPLILAQLAFFPSAANLRHRVYWMIACGALTGLAIAFKQVAAINWLFLVAMYPLFIAREKRWFRTLVFAGWSAAGAAIVWGLIALYFSLKGALGELVYNVFTHNLEYVQAIPAVLRWQLFLETLARLSPTQAIIWIMSAAGFLALYLRGNRKSLIFWSGWMLTSMVGVSASGYFFPHYFQQALPALAVTAVLGAEWFCSARSWKALPVWARRALLGLLLFLLPVIRIWPFLFRYTPAEALRKIYPNNYFAEMPELGARLRAATGPDDRIFIFGAEPELLFYAQRISATRYIFLMPLYGPYADALQKQGEAVEEITLSRPTAAGYLPNSLFFNLPGSEQHFTRWTLGYFKKEFRVDTYLVAGLSGALRFLPAVGDQRPTLAAGERILGAMLLRK